jgi:hypothetical protein
LGLKPDQKIYSKIMEQTPPTLDGKDNVWRVFLMMKQDGIQR